MKRKTAAGVAIVLAGLCLTVVPAPAQKAPAPPPTKGPSARAARVAAALPTVIRHVIIISVDGMMPETYLQPDAYGLKVPTLREIAASGAYSDGLVPVFPSVTYPSHTSIATGVNPGTHGIIANGAWDPMGRMPNALRWYTVDIRVPTLWDVAKARGLKTALIYWPATVGARADAVVQEFWRQDPGTEDDAKLNFAMAIPPGLLESVAARFPNFKKNFLPPRVHDTESTDVAVHLIGTLKPNLLMLHIFDVDHFQHEDGALAGRGLAAIETADEQIARIIAAAKAAGTWSLTALVIVSDHGHARYTQRLRPGIWLREKGLITLDDRNRVTDWKAWLLPSTGSAYVYVKVKADQETKREVLQLFTEAAARPGSGVARVYGQDEIVSMGGDPEAFLAIEAASGWGFRWGYTGDLLSPPATPNAAGHGWPASVPAMRPSLLIYGPSIGHGEIENGRLIDVAPTVASLLGLKLEKAEGRTLALPRR
ncbi:MAG: alkaline phosphatase family protein [Acidobacteria bacterium]|nr:alkaline phosphatase family protein [Acidobacteriota bacterium]